MELSDKESATSKSTHGDARLALAAMLVAALSLGIAAAESLKTQAARLAEAVRVFRLAA